MGYLPVLCSSSSVILRWVDFLSSTWDTMFSNKLPEIVPVTFLLLSTSVSGSLFAASPGHSGSKLQRYKAARNMVCRPLLTTELYCFVSCLSLHLHLYLHQLSRIIVINSQFYLCSSFWLSARFIVLISLFLIRELR